MNQPVPRFTGQCYMYSLDQWFSSPRPQTGNGPWKTALANSLGKVK